MVKNIFFMIMALSLVSSVCFAQEAVMNAVIEAPAVEATAVEVPAVEEPVVILTEQVSGTIVSVDVAQGQLVVKVSGVTEGETTEVTILVNETTTIEKDGGIVALSDLAAGDMVDVICTTDEAGAKVAQDITVKKAE